MEQVFHAYHNAGLQRVRWSNTGDIVRTIQIGVVDLVDLGDRDAKPRVVSVDRTLMSLQPTEAFASPAALRACKHPERVVSRI